MVVNTFVRKTYLVLPRPVRKAVRFALPAGWVKFMNRSNDSTRESIIDSVDAIGNSVFRHLWND